MKGNSNEDTIHEDGRSIYEYPLGTATNSAVNCCPEFEYT